MTATESITDEARQAVEQLLQNDDGRSIHQRMVAIIGELPAIGKTQQNKEQGFMFRGYDQVMNALNPLLAKHGVFIVPNVVGRKVSTRVTSRGSTMYEVNLHVEFTFFGAAGDSFTASGWGEGTDMGDKATNKAMTGAFKYVLFQTFAIATAEDVDSDAGSMEETTRGEARPKREQRSQSRTFDPGKDLLPGAITVATVEDADALRAAQRDLAPAENWPAIEDELATNVFGKKIDELSRAQTAMWWKRLANAVVKAYEKGDFPPPSREEIQSAYGQAFDGAFPALESLEAPFEGTTEAATPEAEKPAGTEA